MQLLSSIFFGILAAPWLGSANKFRSLRRTESSGVWTKTFSCLLVEIDFLVLGDTAKGHKVERHCIFEDAAVYSTFWIEGISDTFWKDNSKVGSGRYYLQIPSADAEKLMPHSSNSGRNVLFVKSTSAISFVPREDYQKNFNENDHETRGLLPISSAPLQVEGTSSVLVVRVTDPSGDAPIKTAAELSYDIFYDKHNLVTQYKACSGGKLNFVPATGYNIVDGVTEVIVPYTVSGRDAATVENWAAAAVYSSVGNFHRWEHVMFVFPSSVYFEDNSIAYAHRNHFLSVFKDTSISSLLALVHEVGHNLDNGHSGEFSKEYGDGTCMMGGGDYVLKNDSPLQCFNGAKSWNFGWYRDRHVTVDPYNDAVFKGKLVGIDDYLNGQIHENSIDHHVVVKVGSDLYLMYNRQEGVNAEVTQYGNLVTVVQQEETTEKGISWLLAGVDEGSEWRYSNWDDSAYDLVVKVCEKVNGTPDYATTLVYLDGLNNIPCKTQNPTSAPTSVPANIPTSTPSQPLADSNQVEAYLYIKLDSYPTDVGWSLRDDDKREIIRSVPENTYSEQVQNQVVQETFKLTRGRSYTFIMSDVYGDGICCSHGFGAYEIFVDGKVIVSNEDGFGYFDSKSFVVPDST